MKTLAASEFKAHCLAILDEVSEEGETVLILKRGLPVARLVPTVTAETSPQATLRGTMVALDDLIEPPLPADRWEAEQA